MGISLGRLMGAASSSLSLGRTSRTESLPEGTRSVAPTTFLGFGVLTVLFGRGGRSRLVVGERGG